MRATAGIARLLDLEPDLAREVPSHSREEAARAVRAEVVSVGAGPWPLRADSGLLGAVVLSGAVCRELPLRDLRMIEFLGPGDIVQPPVADHSTRLGGATTLTAITDSDVALLSPDFIESAMPWPEVLAGVMRRLEEQRERLAVRGVIAQVARADHRVLLVLWDLAERWGRMTSDGMVLSLPLTHNLLGKLCGARRPTVTLAVASLEAGGVVRRAEGGSWVLTQAAARLIEAITRTRDGAPSLAHGMMLRWRALELVRQANAVRAQAEHALTQRSA